MEEEIELYLEEAKEQMDKAVKFASGELNKIRAGKASPEIFDSLRIDYYGALTPLNQLSSVTIPDPRSIIIKPFEKSIISDIERVIINSDLGLNPQNDGDIIRINIPPLSEDRRKQLVKQAKNEAENGKISIRNIRKDINDSLKKLQKEGASEDAVKGAEEEVQKLTDDHTKQIDDLLEKKEQDIMTV
jgi:ribosome recycling factor